MTTYILVYIASFLSAFCYSNSKNRNISFLFKIMTFLILFLPAALRYNVGADYAHYVMIVVFFFLIFLVANLRVHTSDKNSGLGITPYQSIFSR